MSQESSLSSSSVLKSDKLIFFLLGDLGWPMPYEPFLSKLHENLDGQYDIYTVGYKGQYQKELLITSNLTPDGKKVNFETPVLFNEKEILNINTIYDNLDEQLTALIPYFLTKASEYKEIVLMGHSLGTHFVTELTRLYNLNREELFDRYQTALFDISSSSTSVSQNITDTTPLANNTKVILIGPVIEQFIPRYWLRFSTSVIGRNIVSWFAPVLRLLPSFIFQNYGVTSKELIMPYLNASVIFNSMELAGTMLDELPQEYPVQTLKNIETALEKNNNYKSDVPTNKKPFCFLYCKVDAYNMPDASNKRKNQGFNVEILDMDHAFTMHSDSLKKCLNALTILFKSL
jgi:pimeloyl-ACP methyl ester carboxylesterase